MAFTTSHGVPLYFERAGHGPAVVFCHGAGSNAATWWQQVPAFSREYSCVVFDHRCFGRSAAGPDTFDPHLFQDDLLAVMDAAGLDRAALVCQSLGGMAGLRLALQQPHRVSALVLADSPLAIDHAGMLANVRRFLSEVQAAELENRALSPGFVARQPELAFLYRQINLFNPAVHSPSPGDGWGRRLEHLFAPDYLLPLQALERLAVPTLFVVGEQDPVVTPEVVRELAGQVRGASVATISDAGHSPYFEQAGAFNRLVGDFLRQHIQPSRGQP